MSMLGGRDPSRLRGGLGLLLGLLGGCATSEITASSSSPAAPAAPAPPAGAIQVAEDLYQVPLGSDREGCRIYRLHSPTLVVTQAIWYRAANGDFTLDKAQAACRQPTREP